MTSEILDLDEVKNNEGPGGLYERAIFLWSNEGPVSQWVATIL